MSISTISRGLIRVTVLSLLFGGSSLAGSELTEHGEPLAAIQGLNPASVSLPRAIAAIEAKTGGKVMDIDVSNDGGQPKYDAIVVKADKVGAARLSGRTGAVSGIGKDASSAGDPSWENRRDVRSFDKATLPLATAIKTVEQTAGATAVNAGLAKPLTPSNSVLAYNVEVVKNGQVNRIAIDASTGEVIADPGALGLGDRDPGQFLAAAPQ